MSIFFIYKIYKQLILYYTLHIMYTENYVWNYILLSLPKIVTVKNRVDRKLSQAEFFFIFIIY